MKDDAKRCGLDRGLTKDRERWLAQVKPASISTRLDPDFSFKKELLIFYLIFEKFLYDSFIAGSTTAVLRVNSFTSSRVKYSTPTTACLNIRRTTLTPFRSARCLSTTKTPTSGTETSRYKFSKTLTT